MECLDDDTVLALADGRLSADERERIDRHIDECSDCRELLVDVTRLATGPDDAARPVVRIDTAIDHYVVRRWLGSGATAAVYAAEDRQLEREVALKLFHEGEGAAGRRASAEAQALARSHHPHVLTVHAVGTWNGRPYLVTELIDGVSLREWVALRRPPWRALLRTLLAAGEGLAAAHDAGVVHRDFKPDNVIIAADGRPIVVDFGFARLQDDPVAEIAGTPAYMAPEQRAGHADAQSDQFAFARVAHEALGATPRSVPRALRSALRRALAEAPAERFPDLRGLLVALTRAERRRRVAIAAGSIVAGAAVAVALGRALADPRQDVCTTGDTPAATWQAAIDRGAPARLWSEDSAGSTASASRAHAAAAQFVDEWSTAAAEACEADSTDASSCLDVGRVRFARLVESAAAVDPVDFLARLGELDHPRACLDAPGVRPTWPAKREDEIVAIRQQLAQVETLEADGELDAALELAEAAVQRARDLDFAPLVVRAELEWGTLLAERGDGTAELERAMQSATELGLEPLRAQGLLALADAELASGESELAAAHANEADAIVVRLGDSAPELRVDVQNMRGMLAYHAGAYDDALRHAETAIAICSETVDERLPKARFNAGSILQSLGREREALEVFEAALDEMTNELGPDHADVGRAWHSIGAAHNALGEGELALVAYDQALRILEPRLGERHVDTLKAIFGRGNALLGLGRIEEALASYETCVAALDGNQPPPLLVFCLDSQAKAYAELGRTREAGNLWRRALGLAQSRSLRGLPIRATIPFWLAQIDLAEGNRASASALMRDAKATAAGAQWDATALMADIDAWLAANAQ